MAIEEPNPEGVDDEYDEEDDSDFDGQADEAGSISSATEDEPAVDKEVRQGNKATSSRPVVEELDSGDEVTIKERQKSKKKKQKHRKDAQLSSGDEQNAEWRAKTRSMRAHEQAERQRKTLISIKSSTIDVDKVWEEMNKPGPLPPVRVEGQSEERSAKEVHSAPRDDRPKVDTSALPSEEMVTIKRQYKFAGEVHLEEKTVPRSSAEAQLWLAQQENRKTTSQDSTGSKQRPLRKISRFDPNYSDLEAFRNHSIKAQPGTFNGPKLNVVEKSKMDWAVHIDQEGLRDELEVHAKAKDAYMNRMDFLTKVGQRQDDEARAARQKG